MQKKAGSFSRSELILVLLVFFTTLVYYRLLAWNESPSPYLVQAQAISSKCSESPRGEFCYANEFKVLAQSNSLEYTRQVLHQLQQLVSKTSDCHFIGHVISFEEVNKAPDNWQQVLQQISPSECTGGLMMGVMEAFYKNNANQELTSELISQICTHVKQTGKAGSESGCYHIMGHLILVESSGSIDKAIQLFENLPQTIQQYDCYNGAFMEGVVRRNLESHGISQTIPWNETTLTAQQALCAKFQGLAQKACWRELSHLITYVLKHQPEAIYQACTLAPTKTMVNECYVHATGIMAVSTHTQLNSIPKLCDPLIKQPKIHQQCLKTVINSLEASSPFSQDKLKLFCNSNPQKELPECNLSRS